MANQFWFANTKPLHQRDLTRAHIVATSAFDAIEQTVAIEVVEFTGEYEAMQFLRQ